MVESFFKKNVDALRALNSEQAKAIEELSPKVENRLYQTQKHAEDYLNIYYASDGASTFALFSTANPKQEIDQWANSTEFHENPPHVVLLLGFDLGYYPSRVLSLLPKDSLLAIVEPDPLLFFTAIHNRDISTLIGDKRVHLYVGQKLAKAVESIGEELKWSRFLSMSHTILVNPLVRKCYKQYPREFGTRFRNALQRELMYRKSRIESGTEVVINTIQNAEAVIEAPGVNTLFGQFGQIPAVMIAPGPSLEKHIEGLKHLQERALVTCVNTAYPILKKHGITPHLVFTMDHNERNARSFQDDPKTPSSFLVADPRIAPSIVEHFMPNVFFASWRTTNEVLGEPAPLDRIPVPRMSGNAIYLWLQEMTGSKGDVFGPGSVAVVGFHILARMGCAPIIMMGQDLAFSDNKNYADGTIFDDQSLPRDSNAAHMVESTEGNMIPTSETLFLYRQLLEHEIARFNIPVINTGSGANIRGAIMSSLESLIPQMNPLEVDFFQVLHQVRAANPSRITFRDLLRKLQHGVELLEAFVEEAKSGLNDVPDNLSALPRREKKMLLNQLKDCIAVCSEKENQAMGLLNELLQESHFEFEESQWRMEKMQNENEILEEEIHSSIRVLDAFVSQATLLSSLFEEKIQEIA